MALAKVADHSLHADSDALGTSSVPNATPRGQQNAFMLWFSEMQEVYNTQQCVFTVTPITSLQGACGRVSRPQ